MGLSTSDGAALIEIGIKCLPPNPGREHYAAMWSTIGRIVAADAVKREADAALERRS